MACSSCGSKNKGVGKNPSFDKKTGVVYGSGGAIIKKIVKPPVKKK